MNQIVKILALVLFSSSVFALPEDRDQPMYVSADSATIDEKTGVTTYTGDVRMTQGTLLLEADKAVLYRVDGDIERVEAFGNTAHIRQKPEIDKPYTDGWGETIIYKVIEEHATLLKRAKVISDNNTFTGDRILYDLKTSIVEAFSENQQGKKDKRVQMIIQPKNKDGN